MRRFEAWPEVDGVRLAADLFDSSYAAAPTHVGIGPGRVNLIGEHVDYAAGICVPIALPHATYAAIRLREDDRVRLVSGQQDDRWEGTLARLREAPGWAAYAAGVLVELGEVPVRLRGVDIAVTGCVPLGAGLSSSASLETAVATAYLAARGERLTQDRLVSVCTRAETEVAGAPTGGLDQSAAVYGAVGKAVHLDFYRHTDALLTFSPGALSLLVVDTGVTHRHSEGGYGDRRAQVERAAQQLGVDSLRTLLDREQELDRLPEPLRSRARHVVTEIGRAARFVGALKAQSWGDLGPLLNQSHESLRDDFEVSCRELDVVVEAARSAGALGARMTGGGFGGSAIALVPDGALDAVVEAVGRALPGASYDVVTAAAGARSVTVG